MGSILGIVLPLITFFIVYLIRMEDVTFIAFIERLYKLKVLSNLVSLCVIPNLGAFFIFLQLNYIKATRGVLLATIIYGLMIVVIKYM